MHYNSQIETFINIITDRYAVRQNPVVLDVGCGSGMEAAYLNILLGAKVHGIDVVDDFDAWAATKAHLITYNGVAIPFPDDSFDIVYAYHVLEHVEDVPTLLGQVVRVLKSSGIAYFGTPNKQRLFGYFGMNDKALSTKLKQNARDWLDRFFDRFENNRGAHAGFRKKELEKMLSCYFSRVSVVTDQYYHFKWPHRRSAIHIIRKLGLFNLFTPSVYVIGTK